MNEITTNRLTLCKSRKQLWHIKDAIDDVTIGSIGLQNSQLTVALKTGSQGLGVASEAAHALLELTDMQHIEAYPNNIKARAMLERLGFSSHTSGKNQYIFNTSLIKPLTVLDQQLNKQLNICIETITAPKQPTACQLVQTEKDVFQRSGKLHPLAFSAWRKMQLAARSENISLKLVSAFRSIKYQQQIIQKKLGAGVIMKEILKVNVPPGYSEHHTGCAIDIGSNDTSPLEENFESSNAFDWLHKHADKFQFKLSYPRNNPYNIIYEPWHWRFYP
ncbi:MAG: D-alanyl-D-alanine carboxypeptidase family protein [Proteobacteria bacterium]|nr:D-alanyl-D-alanine carboxypeptidase family protein [Pseudomonadota bacterium]